MRMFTKFVVAVAVTLAIGCATKTKARNMEPQEATKEELASLPEAPPQMQSAIKKGTVCRWMKCCDVGGGCYRCFVCD